MIPSINENPSEEALGTEEASANAYTSELRKKPVEGESIIIEGVQEFDEGDIQSEESYRKNEVQDGKPRNTLVVPKEKD